MVYMLSRNNRGCKVLTKTNNSRRTDIISHGNSNGPNCLKTSSIYYVSITPNSPYTILKKGSSPNTRITLTKRLDI